jgi:hypothetical protein
VRSRLSAAGARLVQGVRAAAAMRKRVVAVLLAAAAVPLLRLA